MRRRLSTTPAGSAQQLHRSSGLLGALPASPFPGKRPSLGASGRREGGYAAQPGRRGAALGQGPVRSDAALGAAPGPVPGLAASPALDPARGCCVGAGGDGEELAWVRGNGGRAVAWPPGATAVESDAFRPWATDPNDDAGDFAARADLEVYGAPDPVPAGPGHVDLSRFGGHSSALAMRYSAAGVGARTHAKPSKKAVVRRQLYRTEAIARETERAQWKELIAFLATLAPTEPCTS
ncbi:hypothetical protein DIPPA_04888 [Diplonema papillatum]|nr:hypothetical protein DIPPA_04888 [Diplonema papillatum]